MRPDRAQGLREPAAFVRNAADAGQVKDARRREKDARAQELTDLRAVLGTQPGRRVLWRLLGYCGVFRSIAASDALRMAFNAGAQDVGHFLQAEISAADTDAYLQMQIEAAATTKHEPPDA